MSDLIGEVRSLALVGRRNPLLQLPVQLLQEIDSIIKRWMQEVIEEARAIWLFRSRIYRYVRWDGTQWRPERTGGWPSRQVYGPGF